VTFAVEAEFDPWRRLRLFNSIDFDGLRLWKTTAGSAVVTVLVTGMGEQSAAHAMGLMMRMADDDKYFDVCISSGLAGALKANLSVGDVIAPESLISENMHADVKSDQMRVDPELRRLALEEGAVCADCLVTTDRVLVKASEKKACSARAQSVDMESFEIVKEANAWGARCVVVRAISDSAGEDLPINFNLTISEARQISVAKVMLQVARNPLALPALIRFGKQSRKAAGKLVTFLDAYVQKLEQAAPQDRSSKVGAR
jgi:adenosylhomocysteine nucleosidase